MKQPLLDKWTKLFIANRLERFRQHDKEGLQAIKELLKEYDDFKKQQLSKERERLIAKCDVLLDEINAIGIVMNIVQRERVESKTNNLIKLEGRIEQINDLIGDK